MADVSLSAFDNPHLKVDRVAHDVDLGRLQVVEQVTAVPVLVAHGVLVFRQSLVHQLLVVHVALLHAEDAAQIVGREHRIAHPCYVADVVFLAFIHLYEYVDVLGVYVPHAVAHDVCVAVTQLVILVDKVLLVFLVTLGRVLLRFQERRELARLVHLLESALLEQAAFYLIVGKLFVTLDYDLAHLHLLLLVNDDVEDYLVLVDYVFTLHYVDVGVLVALFVKIVLRQQLGAVNHVGSYLAALQQSELSLEVLLLRLLHAFVIDGRHSRAQRKVKVQVDAVAYNRVGNNLCFREQSVTPVVLHGVGDV